MQIAFNGKRIRVVGAARGIGQPSPAPSQPAVDGSLPPT